MTGGVYIYRKSIVGSTVSSQNTHRTNIYITMSLIRLTCILAITALQLCQGRILLQYHRCPVLFNGKCFKVLESPYLFPKTAGQKACEIAFPGDEAHLANIYNETLFLDLVEYVQKLEYNPSIILTGMQYFDKKIHQYDGTSPEDLSWDLSTDKLVTAEGNRNICLSVVSYDEGSSRMLTSGNDVSSFYSRILCEYSPK